MPDFGSEVMAEALAQRALVKPIYTIPIIPLSSANQYRHQDHMDIKDYKKVRPSTAVLHTVGIQSLLLLLKGFPLHVVPPVVIETPCKTAMKSLPM